MTHDIDRHLTAIAAEGAAETTKKAREELLRRLDRELPYGLEEATTEELREWLSRAGWTPKTRETYWCHIVAFYRWACGGRQPIYDYDPSADMKRPHVGYRLPRVANDAQLEHALHNLHRMALRAVVLAAGVGMRASEVASAEREHFTKKRVLIHGKGDKMRSVPVPPDVWAAVEPCPPGRLVLNRGQPVGAKWVTERVSDALTAIGEPRLTMHYFRGKYATRLRDAGVDAFTIARLMGHSSVATTQRYIALVDAELDQAVAKLPPLPLVPEPAVIRLGDVTGVA